MDSFQEFYAESLARFGGFSHKSIAAKVFHSTPERVSYERVKAVSNYLRKKKVRVMDWRGMVSAEAKAAADLISKPKRRRRKKAG